MTVHGLAISTYVRRDSPAAVRFRLPETLRTLRQSNYPGRVVVVDDGSNCPNHHEFLAGLAAQYKVLFREENGGVARAKNTSIRALMDEPIDVGFLADDDVEFRQGWWEKYLEAHEMTRIHHFSWSTDVGPGAKTKQDYFVDGYRIAQTRHLNGPLLTFTAKVIEQVGGFRILPGKWGYTHVHWTRRIVAARLAPCWCDIADSNQYVQLNRFGLAASSVSDRDKVVWSRANRGPARDLSRIHYPLEE